jgi:hypothetical protein
MKIRKLEFKEHHMSSTDMKTNETIIFKGYTLKSNNEINGTPLYYNYTIFVNASGMATDCLVNNCYIDDICCTRLPIERAIIICNNHFQNVCTDILNSIIAINT